MMRVVAAWLTLICLFAGPVLAEPRLPLKGGGHVVEDYFYARENSVVYVGHDHATVVGATWTPHTAELLAAEIREITTSTAPAAHGHAVVAVAWRH